MKRSIVFEIPKINNIILELDDSQSPNTVKQFLQNIPFSTRIHVWGQEIYTDPTPLKAEEENAAPLVGLFDVAYWPPGQVLCLFYGPTPIGSENQIKPYSPVNVMGKIKNPDKGIVAKLRDGMKAKVRQP